ncbi:MAG: DNA polymerase III subunit beta, partial [Candidatus Promineifilaceae bacterium]|nr:DNA polymerase III subunit beta [Candidatus Promineifilaceae bacterium]
MKFNVSSQDLLHQLNKAAGAISSNPVLPVLEDFLFEIAGKTLTITATNLETTIITDMQVAVEEEGRIAVPAKILLDTLKALPDQPITMSIDDETRGVEITSEYGKYKLAGDNPEDYPELQDVSGETAMDIDAEVLANALSKTLFATSNDDLRIAMTGVFVQIDFNKITFVATDAHKLVKYTYGGVSTEQTGSFIIPKKSLSLLRGVLHDDGKVAVQHNKSNVSFTLDGAQLVCRLIDANYPDYNAVIPSDNPNVMTVSRTDFQNSLRRIAIYANKTTNQVVLNIDDGSLTISAQDLDFSNEATEQLSCEYDGEGIVIGFNGRFLIEMLSVMDTDQIRFELSTPNRAGIMLPGEQKEH